MDGSHRSKDRKSRQLLLALLALIALTVAACGGGTANNADAADNADAVDNADTADAVEPATGETTSPATDADPEETAATDEDVDATDAPDAAMAEGSDDIDTDTGDDVVVDAEDAIDEVTDAADDDNNAAAGGLAQVLALAVDNSEGQSYSFAQGMEMRLSFDGESLDIAPEDAFVFGEVENGFTHLDMNLGVIMTATFDSVGIDVSQPPFDEVFASLTDAGIEMWTDEQTLVMDMSSFANSIGNLDPEQAAELGQFADGPVSIDLTQLDGVDAATLANQFGQGGQVIDPAQILQSLRGADAITEAGTSQVNGVDVQVFSAKLSMAQYFDALGVDPTEQLSTANLGLETEADAELAEALLPALENLQVDIEVMVDADDLVRRLEIGLDMGAMLETMFSDPDALEALAASEGQTAAEFQAELGSLDGLEMTMTTWQEFDNYGESFGLTLPDAVDVTTELDLAS